MTRVGILHPGEMGSSIGACARQAGAEVFWVSAGRSRDTRERAKQAGLTALGDLDTLIDRVDVVVSVCPPHAARDVAKATVEAGFDKVFLDANAISPDTARDVAKIVRAAGCEYVDGGIIGPPALRPDVTRMYLSGDGAGKAMELFRGSNLKLIDLGPGDAAASALKMCYASWTKGTSALLLAIRALARSEGVDDALVAEWSGSQAGLPERSEGAARGSSRKAWRFVGEMLEIAHSFESAGLPGGFHRGAADLYERLSVFKDAKGAPTLDDVVSTLLGEHE
ncbi:MAG: DUF1932 domain-containing protein [Gammaproteobacteria bacterium]|jgi:3-hydroxyisobutyrate dehydrogenase-like beta-hydroxyacid dehydrogenase